MKNILKLYKKLEESKERFIDETFELQIYNPVRPQLTIIDGGAYGGEFSFYCLPFAKKIYAFEPDPKPYAIMEQLIKEFELGDIIELSSKALAGSNGKKWFRNSGAGGSSFAGGTEGENNIEVETITIATVFKENNIEQLDILKVDMENAELEVFSAPSFKEVKDKIKMIIGEHFQDSEKIMIDYGFKKDYKNGNFIFTK